MGNSFPSFIYTHHLRSVVCHLCNWYNALLLQYIIALNPAVNYCSKESLLSHKPLRFLGALFCPVYHYTSQLPLLIRDCGLFLFVYRVKCAREIVIAFFHGAVLCCQTVTISFLSLICHRKQLCNLRNVLMYLLMCCFLKIVIIY